MLNNVISFKETISVPSKSPEEINQVVGIPKVVTEIDEKGNLISKLVFEETPIEKLNDGLKVDDFALEKLIANGYEPHRLDVNAHSFGDIDRLSSVAETLPFDEESVKNVKPYVKKGE